MKDTNCICHVYKAYRIVPSLNKYRYLLTCVMYGIKKKSYDRTFRSNAKIILKHLIYVSVAYVLDQN